MRPHNGRPGATTIRVITEKNCARVRGTIHACDDEWGLGSIVAVFGGIGGGMGAAAGAAIGATIKHRETVFDASTPGRLSFGPLVDATHAGMLLSIRF